MWPLICVLTFVTNNNKLLQQDFILLAFRETKSCCNDEVVAGKFSSLPPIWNTSQWLIDLYLTSTHPKATVEPLHYFGRLLTLVGVFAMLRLFIVNPNKKAAEPHPEGAQLRWVTLKPCLENVHSIVLQLEITDMLHPVWILLSTDWWMRVHERQSINCQVQRLFLTSQKKKQVQRKQKNLLL